MIQRRTGRAKLSETKINTAIAGHKRPYQQRAIRAASLAMGGDWHDLGGGLTEGDEFSVSLQPLARIHDTYERAWAADWIVAILLREGIAITPEVKEHLWRALTSLASPHPSHCLRCW
ncbi:MAG: hypothetical protein BGO16_08680 [Nitrobacter sp. 62-23]|nr:MAG: hypothetical protein BGO16_08680 [Nitrobacter sp. 62-23]